MNLTKINGKNIEESDFVLINPNYKNFNNGDKVLVVVDNLATVKTNEIGRDILADAVPRMIEDGTGGNLKELEKLEVSSE